ncbi:hypothetical protein [uncultured Roseobacter sp.]|uniref:hypothetical protein n=1 Tax=uncultured Roseobacter sp. TaxID=114847 RepID=UPI00261D8A65|nr:hypothetical protein [uncultured Roseobacter sp.]
MDGAADTMMPDPGLDRLGATVPDLYIGPGDYVRIHTYLTGLIDQGWQPQSTADYGPHMAMLLARDESEERAIRAFYADDDALLADPDPVVELAPLQAPDDTEARVLLGQKRVMAFLLFLGVSVIVTLTLWQTGWLDIVNTVPAETEDLIENPDLPGPAGPGEAPEVVEEIAEAVAFAVTGQGMLRGLLMLLPLGLAGWLMYRAATRQAGIDPEAAKGLHEAEKKRLPGPDHTGLLTSPFLTSSMGLLRLRREQTSTRIDPERTASLAARTAGRAITLAWMSESHSVAHLVLVDRRNQTDHLGALGDLVLERLQQAGVEAQAYDLLADPSRLIRCRTPVTEAATIRSAAALSDEHRGDVVVFVAEAGRLLDRFGRSLAPWVAGYGAPRMLALMTPRPRAHWGRAERTLIDMGVAVFPISAAGVRDYVRYRVASLSERPQAVPEASPEVPSWSLSEAVEEVEEADQDEDAREDAVFALQSALSPRAFGLLSVLSIFPLLLPELTLRMRKLLFEGGAGATDIVAELSALPWFREGRLPFWLRVSLVSGLPEARGAAARDVIEAFQSDIGDGLEAERTLALARRPDRLRQFLGSFGPKVAHEITTDAIFTRFMKAEDVTGLTVRARGEMGDDLRWRMRAQLAVYAGAGLLMSFAMWFVAPTLIFAAQGGLLWIGRTFAQELQALSFGPTRFYCLLFILTLIAMADRQVPRIPWLKLTRAPAVLACIALAVLDLALISEALDSRTDPRNSWSTTSVQGLALTAFLLILALRKRSSQPFDPVFYASERRIPQLLAGFALLLATNVFVAFAIIFIGGVFEDLEVQMSVAMAVSAFVLMVHVLTPHAVTLRRRWRVWLSATGSLLPLSLVFTGAILLSDVSQSLFSNGISLESLVLMLLILLLPVLYQARLIRLRYWVVIAAAFLGVFLFEDQFGREVADFLGAVNRPGSFLATYVPPAVTLTLCGVILWRYLAWRWVLIRWVILYCTLAVAGILLQPLISTLGSEEIIIIPPPEPLTSEVPTQNEPSAIVPPDNNTALQQLPADVGKSADPEQNFADDPPVLLEEPVVIVEEAESFALFGAVVDSLLLTCIVIFVTFAHLFWLRHKRIAENPWRAGPVWALYLTPVAMLPGLTFAVTDALRLDLSLLAPAIAVLLAQRFGYWGLMAFIFGGLTWSVQVFQVAEFLSWGASPDLLIVSVMIARLFVEPGHFTRVLSRDTIRPGQYVMIGLFLLLPEFSYGFGPMGISLEYEDIILLGGFMIGMTGVPLLRPVLFVIGMAALRGMLNQLDSFIVFSNIFGDRAYNSITVMEILLAVVAIFLGRGLHNIALYRTAAPYAPWRIFSLFQELPGSIIHICWLQTTLLVIICADILDFSVDTGTFRLTSDTFLASLAAFALGAHYAMSYRQNLQTKLAYLQPVAFAFIAFYLSGGFAGGVPEVLFDLVGVFSVGGIEIRFDSFDPLNPLAHFAAFVAGSIVTGGTEWFRKPVLRDVTLWVPFKEKYDDSITGI